MKKRIETATAHVQVTDPVDIDNPPIGYYWLHREDMGQEPPYLVAVLETPRGKVIQYIGVDGIYALPSQVRSKLSGPIFRPPAPRYPKTEEPKTKEPK